MSRRTTYKTKASAEAAARRTLRNRFGSSYQPYKTIDYTVSFSFANQGWTIHYMI